MPSEGQQICRNIMALAQSQRYGRRNSRIIAEAPTEVQIHYDLFWRIGAGCNKFHLTYSDSRERVIPWYCWALPLVIMVSAARRVGRQAIRESVPAVQSRGPFFWLSCSCGMKLDAGEEMLSHLADTTAFLIGLFFDAKA